MSKSYTEIARFPSSLSAREYTVKQDEEGALSCDCPVWKFNQRRDRTCKHTDLVLSDEVPVPEPVEDTPPAKTAGLKSLAELLRELDGE